MATTNWLDAVKSASALESAAASAQSAAASDLKGVVDGKLAAAGGTGDTAGLREVAEKKRAAAAYAMPDGFSTPTKAPWSK